MKYEINGNKITVNGKEVIFDNDIDPNVILEIDRLLVIILIPKSGEVIKDNVYAVSDTGEILWRIESRNLPLDAGNEFVHLYIDPAENINDTVQIVGATDFGGYACSIDINTGKILSTRFFK